MELIIAKTKEEASRKAADLIACAVRKDPKIVLGLATGSTPETMYSNLAEDCKAGKVTFADVKSWNLDEYVGLEPTHDQSYRYFMNAKLFDHIDINKENTHVLNGLATDVNAECEAYEKEIKDAGGIAIQVLGIGSDGHIAFNEPGSSLVSRTRKVALTPQTIQDNARFFEKAEDVPRFALSMGIGTIMEAKRIIILAFGANKADAVAGAFEGAVSAFCPASILQMHPDVWFFCDEAAAANLKLKDYYAWHGEEVLKEELGG
ncbi:MAG: glucosamine-6-phosphate deaminase [Kiritimatiellae bacterium]|jgi:glucosamine-6-phosphate deaminase|nr:glucosamine-6-phosphate deaminase [Kiritimatiellia bacterium]